jgi:hypothetical protein
MTKTRIYLVNVNADDNTVRPPRLVRAANRAQAERHVAAGMITSHVASQDELIEHLSAGIEVAGEDVEEHLEGEAA